MPLATEIQSVSIVGINQAQAAGEAPLLLSRDGSAAAASIPVPAGETLVISDWINSADLLVPFRLQKTTDGGATWFDMVLMRTGPQDSNKIGMRTPLVIVGGADVAIRVLCDPPAPAVVMSTIRCQTQP